MNHDPQDQADPPTPIESTPPRGFASLSQKIFRRTTDLIAVAIVVVGLLAVGGKLGRWWNTGPEDVHVAPPIAGSSNPWGLSEDGVTLSWGELPYSIHHRTIAGDAETIAEQLEEIAVGQLLHSSPPKTPPAPGEQRLLAELAKVPASRKLASGESLYRIGEKLPMVLITAPSTNEKEAQERVLCWARAFPQSAGQWMVFAFYSAGSQPNSASEERLIPLPPRAKRIQGISDPGGSSWLAFRGSGPVAKWRRHFDQWFADANWSAERDWSETSGTWQRAYASPGSQERVAIWLISSGNGGWEGMLYGEWKARRDPDEAEIKK